MARTAITPQNAGGAGATVAFEPANVDGNSFRPALGRVLHVRNSSGSAITVTLPTPGTASGLAIADRTLSVAAGAHGAISLGPVPVPYLQTDGVVHVDYSAVTTVTVAVVDG